MIGSKKISIVRYLRSLISFRFLPRNRFYWLLLLSSTPLLFSTEAGLSVASAQQKVAQVVVGASVNRPTLKLGSEGVPVRELQGALRLLGFYGGQVNGIFTQSTQAAVSRFQRAAGLRADGVVDTNTWKALFPGANISKSVANTPELPSSIDNFPMPTESINSIRVINNSTQQRRITNTVNNPIRVNPEPQPATPVKPKPKPKPTTTTTKKPKPVQKQAATTKVRQTTTTRRRSTSTTRKTPPIQYTAAGLPILRPGMRGSQVVKLQEKLSNLGFLKSGVDGDFGPVTTEAVKAFQKRNGLEADGVVGGATWNLLQKRKR